MVPIFDPPIMRNVLARWWRALIINLIRLYLCNPMDCCEINGYVYIT